MCRVWVRAHSPRFLQYILMMRNIFTGSRIEPLQQCLESRITLDLARSIDKRHAASIHTRCTKGCSIIESITQTDSNIQHCASVTLHAQSANCQQCQKCLTTPDTCNNALFLIQDTTDTNTFHGGVLLMTGPWIFGRARACCPPSTTA